MSGNGALMVAPPFPPEYRASGLLLHVTSLPSPYGVGDLGASAFSWIDRLHDAGLAWWQALPLGPTGYGNSPYPINVVICRQRAADQPRLSHFGRALTGERCSVSLLGGRG